MKRGILDMRDEQFALMYVRRAKLGNCQKLLRTTSIVDYPILNETALVNSLCLRYDIWNYVGIIIF
jgi:hypothetical protein